MAGTPLSFPRLAVRSRSPLAPPVRLPHCARGGGLASAAVLLERADTRQERARRLSSQQCPLRGQQSKAPEQCAGERLSFECRALSNARGTNREARPKQREDDDRAAT